MTDVRRRSLLILPFWALLFIYPAGCGHCRPDPATKPGPAVRTPDDIVSRWGVRVEMIALTAAGRMVDFRYRVLDPQKSAPLFDRNNKACLLHQATQKTLTVPTTAKVGPLRNTGASEQGRIYWMFFDNPGIVKPGDKVTIIIGDFKIADLAVQ